MLALPMVMLLAMFLLLSLSATSGQTKSFFLMSYIVLIENGCVHLHLLKS